MTRTKSAFLALLAILLSPLAANADLIVNGDFEDTTATNDPSFNLSNAAFNSVMSDATAFGDAQEIDLTGNTWGIAPQSGNWKLSLHTQTTGLFDAFSLDLLSAVSASNLYQLQFYAASFGQGTAFQVDIGLSNIASSFGDLLFSASSSSGAWQLFDFDFAAASDALFLTVRADPFATGSNYGHVDNFSLVQVQQVQVPEPGTLALFGIGLLGMGAARRRKKV